MRSIFKLLISLSDFKTFTLFNFDLLILILRLLDLSKAKIFTFFYFLITDLAIDDPIIPKPIMRIFLNIKFIGCFYCLFHVTFCSNGHPNKIM